MRLDETSSITYQCNNGLSIDKLFLHVYIIYKIYIYEINVVIYGYIAVIFV